MISIVMKNLQAIKEAYILIKDNTIVEFVGDNSNGKSILAKTLQYILSGDIKDKDTRRALINDNAEQAQLVITWNEKMLGFVITEAFNTSGFVYQKNRFDENSKIIQRTISEGGLDKVLYDFGFRTYAGGDICLQLHPTWGQIPFITTSGKVNEEIVSDIITDKIADNFIESFSKITYPEFQRQFKMKKAQLEDRKKVLANMKDYDYEAFGRLAEEMKEIRDIISEYEYSEMKRPIIPPQIDFIDLGPARFLRPSGMDCAPICGYLTRPTKTLHTFVEINNGVCPTCKRPFFEHN